MKKFLAFLLAIIFLCTPLTACETTPQTVDSSNFYFSQLNDIEKEIYLNLKNTPDSHILNQYAIIFQRNTFDDLLNDITEDCNFIRALTAYELDNPMTGMWINPIDMSLDVKEINTSDATTSMFQIYIYSENEKGTSFPNSAELQEAINQVENTVQQFVKTLHGTDSEKIKAIHDWIIRDATYEDTPYSRNIYGALIEKKAICYGFAHAFKYVCDAAQLNTVTIYGKTHVWNYVQLEDGRWYLVDTTWDLEKGDTYLLVEIDPEFTSGKRSYEDYYKFSYSIFHN